MSEPAIGRCITKRVLRLPCPICQQTVDVTVVNWKPGTDPQAWLDDQPIEEWDKIHAACELETSRTRTRRMTPP